MGNTIEKKQEYTVTKTTVELYRFRHPSGMYWADITIDSGEKSGRISIASDFGTYSNYWSHAGQAFKEFLGEIAIDYAADKFGADRWFDHAETLLRFSEYANESSKEDLRDLIMEEIRNLQEHTQKESFIVELMHSPGLMRLFDGCPELEYSITPQFKRLWKEVWPELIKAFKAEKEVHNG